MKELIGFFGEKFSAEHSSDYISFIEEFYNNAPNAYHSLDANGYFLKVNDTELKMLGYTREELIGKKRFFDLQITLLTENAEEFYRQFKQTGTTRNLELELVSKTGNHVQVLLNANAIYDKDGNFIASNSVIVDITHKKALEKELMEKNQELNHLNEQLFHTNQEKNRFIGIASHDLQNPITNIKLIAGKFRKTAQNLTDSQKRWIDELVSTSERMASLIKNMLSVNRLERESIAPEIDYHNIVQLLTTSLNRFEEIANRKGISLHFESQAPLFMAKTDQEYLTEIIDNLVSNAIKFSYADSSVSVKLECTSSYFEISVQDQGQGILPEEMNLLFGRFQKLSAKPTSNESSTGLGLSIVKELAEQLGGTVSCHSQIGKGTCFTVRFNS